MLKTTLHMLAIITVFVTILRVLPVAGGWTTAIRDIARHGCIRGSSVYLFTGCDLRTQSLICVRDILQSLLRGVALGFILRPCNSAFVCAIGAISPKLSISMESDTKSTPIYLIDVERKALGIGHVRQGGSFPFRARRGAMEVFTASCVSQKLTTCESSPVRCSRI
jgi:hypothetical protein